MRWRIAACMYEGERMGRVWGAAQQNDCVPRVPSRRQSQLHMLTVVNRAQNALTASVSQRLVSTGWRDEKKVRMRTDERVVQPTGRARGELLTAFRVRIEKSRPKGAWCMISEPKQGLSGKTVAHALWISIHWLRCITTSKSAPSEPTSPISEQMNASANSTVRSKAVAMAPVH